MGTAPRHMTALARYIVLVNPKHIIQAHKLAGPQIAKMIESGNPERASFPTKTELLEAHLGMSLERPNACLKTPGRHALKPNFEHLPKDTRQTCPETKL